MHRNLQSMIQVFVRVIFWGIGRQKKHLNFIFALFQPGRNKLAMMNLQIVQNQEDFPFRAANQTRQKADQALLVHRVLINHVTHFPLPADRRDHIDPLPLRLHRQHRGASLRRKPALYDFTIPYACLICPVDAGILCFRTF